MRIASNNVMKFSDAVTRWAALAWLAEEALAEAVESGRWADGAVSTVAGRPMRRRSVALGTSSCAGVH